MVGEGDRIGIVGSLRQGNQISRLYRFMEFYGIISR